MTSTESLPAHISGQQIADRVVAYYDQTWLDFRLLWIGRDNLALHYGYHDAATRGHADALARLNQVLAERIALAQGERVLDAGCGVGGSSIWLAAQRGATTVGITLSERQVLRARRLAAKRGLGDRVRFEQADYASTPFPAGSFDVVWAIESVCYAPDKPAFFREAARLLRPGGRLVMADFMRARRPLDREGEPLLRDWLDGWAMPDLGTGAEYLRAIAAAGLADAQLDDVTARILPSARRLYTMARWSYPIGVALRRLGLRSDVQHGNVRAALRQYQSLRRGGWWYSICSAVKP
jgi:cyclopropane fatty-acyl-phospholipid synthase-like methyltransferase